MNAESQSSAVVEGAIGEESFTRPASRINRNLRILVFLLVTWPLVAWISARALIVSSDMQHADAIVVLGGSATFVERTQYAAKLFHEGKAPRILLTNDGQQGGWSTSEQRNPLFIERATKELQSGGVPSDKIEALPQVNTSTHEEATLLREYLNQHGLKSVLVVTSAYHSRRAIWTMRRAFDGSGVELGITSPPTGWQTPPPATWWLYRNGWRLVAGEYAKLIYYYLKY